MSAIKLSYVVATPELRREESVTAYQGDMDAAFRRLRDLEYDGAELMIRDPDRLERGMFEQLSRRYGIEIPALCTGEVFGQDRLSFMDPDKAVRDEAVRRMQKIIDFASAFGAQVNIGRLRGQFHPDIPRERSLSWMYTAFEVVTSHAGPRGVTITIEPVPRVEWNNIFNNRDGIEVLKKMGRENFRLMADVYAMNIEEHSIAESFRDAQAYLAHIHISDSNRLAPGGGNMDFPRIADAIRAIDYRGYVSAELIQFPNQEEAMETTIRVLKPLLRAD
jgi:sugar phosphate isomerase/epimerase